MHSTDWYDRAVKYIIILHIYGSSCREFLAPCLYNDPFGLENVVYLGWTIKIAFPEFLPMPKTHCPKKEIPFKHYDLLFYLKTD